MSIGAARDSLQRGEFVLIFDADDREGETDLVKGAEFVTPPDIHTMRLHGGGLIILMIPYAISQKLDLPFLSDIFYTGGDHWPVLRELVPNDIPYDSKSSFSVTINHRKTFTGISDQDRALTISQFPAIIHHIDQSGVQEAQKIFGASFRAPGHVPICIAAKNLLQERQGHTELAVSLALMAGITPVMTACEMIGDRSSLPKNKAQDFAQKKGYTFIEGSDILEAWETWSE